MAQYKNIYKRLQKLYNIEDDSIKEINEYGELFECVVQGKTYILRITDYKTYAEQRAEADFINFMYVNGIGVANVIPSHDDNLVEVVNLKDKEVYVVLFAKAVGHHPSNIEWNSRLIEKCGQIIGRMHKLSMEYSNPTKYNIINWYEHNELDYLKHIPLKHELIIEKCKALFNEIKQLPKNNYTYGLIHSDIGQGNMFVDGDKVTIFDFQDCEHNYFINDLAVMIYFGIEDSFNGRDIKSYSIEFINSLLKGYRKENKIEPYWIDKIPLFLKLREILSFIIFYCYWDVDTFNEDRKARLNLYRKNIEFDIPVLNIDFSQFY
ncbi:MAG: phosphotransferase [Ruminiclostridium sp.]|nr:phosphotransferase [Ruminiclostridium sp.]